LFSDGFFMEDDIIEDLEERNEKLFPKDLEGRLEVVANAVNTEFKSVTLLHLDDIPRDYHEIKASIKGTRGRGYLPNVRVFGRYGDTLHDIALVAKQTIIRDKADLQTIGYSLTEAGRIYGVPIASSALKWTVDNEISMYSVLGSTASRGETRSPYNRIRILELLGGSMRRETDLVELISLRRSCIFAHLIALSKVGFVRFDSVGDLPKGKFTFARVEEKDISEANLLLNRPDLTRRVIEFVKRTDGEFDSYSIAKAFDYKFLGHISGILCHLERQGFLERIFPWIGGEKLSEVEILDKGRRYLDEFVAPVREHLSCGNAINVSFGDEFGSCVARGIELYKKVSPNVNKKNVNQRVEQIKDYLIKNPGATSNDIANNNNLSLYRVRFYLSGLGEMLRVEREGNRIGYFIKRS